MWEQIILSPSDLLVMLPVLILHDSIVNVNGNIKNSQL